MEEASQILEAVQISFKNLEKCLKTLKNGGGGWLDVQKNLRCYYITMRKNDLCNRDQRFKQQFWITKKLKPAKLIKSPYVLWYENLWKINNRKIPKTTPEFVTTMVPPTIYGNLGEVPGVKVKFLSDLKAKQKGTKNCVNYLLTSDNLGNETIKEMLAIILKKDMNDKSLENKNNEWLKENFERTTNIALILGLGDEHTISKLLRRKIEKYINENCYQKAKISNNFKKLLAEKVDNLKQQINNFLKTKVDKETDQTAIKELRTILNTNGPQALIKALEYINELTL